MIETPILLGLSAMFFWGFSDFIAKRVIAQIGVLKTILVSMSVEILVIMIILFTKKKDIYLPDNPWILVIAASLNIMAVISFYRGIEIGNVSIITPITASNVVIVVLLSVLFLDELLIGKDILTIILIILGIILISTKLSELNIKKIKKAKGISYALTAMILWGIVIYLLAIIVRSYDIFLTAIFLRIFGVISVSLLIARKKPILNIKVIKEQLKRSGLIGNVLHIRYIGWSILIVAFAEFLGLVSFSYGIRNDLVSIITPIACASPLITILFARIFYKEKLELNQMVGAMLILLGIFGLSI